MQDVNAKVGTVPMRITIWGNKAPQISEVIRWRESGTRGEWQYAVVDNTKPILFISKM